MQQWECASAGRLNRLLCPSKFQACQLVGMLMMYCCLTILRNSQQSGASSSHWKKPLHHQTMSIKRTKTVYGTFCWTAPHFGRRITEHRQTPKTTLCVTTFVLSLWILWDCILLWPDGEHCVPSGSVLSRNFRPWHLPCIITSLQTSDRDYQRERFLC